MREGEDGQAGGDHHDVGEAGSNSGEDEHPTDGDGTVSHEEFIAYQTKIFDMMDTSTTHKGMLGKEEIMFATGGNNRH